ncbi:MULTISPECIES: ParA family protein [unclassified Streptomyces]|uniref:ParA family protein n=1 Tax=unclassified Streptomyces TaxID=2593676 RepID=UPI0008830BA5|nr:MULTISPECIES: ParA family protein [unclassified Streptomyces]PBC72337.1 chromosome partitioning protein [Streptomyces sp. 2321.6]SDR62125.1 chromosome partitioning protein [Streptomyces sp. KS_16]SEE50438.1 chromosome partitioning protein [Streptomyces sp. 2133.1]SNC77841.1 chromosome partitioning protein [Streptomyces sp. 2114.4]
MTSPQSDREKVVSKLPAALRQPLKVRTAQLGIALQDAVAEGITAWRALGSNLAAIDTAGAESFSTWLPEGQWDQFRTDASARGVSLIQGLAQAVQLWLDTNPAPTEERPEHPRRKVICNQKGGVGKTTVTAGIGQAYAENPDQLYPVRVSKQMTDNGLEAETADLPGLGLRVLLVDFDPQGHLTKQLGHEPLDMQGDTLAKHMSADKDRGELRDLIVPIAGDQFGGRIDLLPACQDAFLLDVRLSGVRFREAALERALAPIEDLYDVIVVDCPPSLGMSMDAAVYYGRRRDGEKPGKSGVGIVVQAEDSSADAYSLLVSQIEDLRTDMGVEVDYLGLIVNLYDGRRGFIATSSLEQWKAIKDPRVVAVIPDRREQREAVRMKEPLLVYASNSEQAANMRALAREIS